MHSEIAIESEPHCTVTPLPGIGELRCYHGVVQPFAAHAHDHYVIGLVRGGCRHMLCNGRSFELGPGDIITFNPGDVHACEQDDGSSFAYESIAIARDLLDGATLMGPKAHDDTITQAFERMLEAASALDETALATTLASLVGILEITTEATKGPVPLVANDEAARHAFAHLCGHLASPLPVEELALREGISKYALIRAYRRRYSITPLQHLASLRVECARKLLAANVDPACVAAETGFCDQAHLTRVFKQRMGVTPGAYRKMMTGAGASS